MKNYTYAKYYGFLLLCLFMFCFPVHASENAYDNYAEEVTEVTGIWFPKMELLYHVMIADPQRVACIVNWRFRDDIVHRTTQFVSLGEYMSIFRWLNVGCFHGDMELAIEASTQSIFMKQWGELLNTDFYVGLPVTYAFDNWSFRFRYYHRSGHLGDEYITLYNVTRVNPCMEAVDFFASYYLASAIRLYGGIGSVVRSDKTYRLKRLYGECGVELRLLARDDLFSEFCIQPYLAMHFRFWSDHKWDMDSNYALGVEMRRQNARRKVRLYIGYHDGQTFLGQFGRKKNSCVSMNFSYGF